MQTIYWNIANGFNRWDARMIIDMSPMPPKVETSGYILKKIPKQYIETLPTVSTVGTPR